MKKWELSDLRNPADHPENFPSVVIHTPEQLREELNHLAQREPAIVVLKGPAEKTLEVGIGGSVAGIRWWEGKSSERNGTILAEQTWTDQRVDFAAEEDFVSFWPESLIPIDHAIEILVFFYEHHCLPEWTSWKQWNDGIKEWEIISAKCQPPHTLAAPNGDQQAAAQATPARDVS